ncbi:helix-turn-helix domain-containing protein [Acaryochloris sp. CCMEE 5410]|uniref:helix-turn-helix domain-containing protein n=1 Tax=Acaryochloris sp. CCMEE 5410 TaxID=310037 RepID=UPI0002483CAE|nr:helix-turn-helix domain-containing protein [Acaryochloris sp. CCMEE 5410]KAI9132697.1 helix-turn-helix domain-containing protein [Acaryochloris sp. CCMEE 5410]
MNISSPTVLAEYARDRRKRMGLNQSEVGDRTGVRQVTVSAFENRPASTKLETLFKLLSALELELQVVPKEQASNANQGWDEEW